MKKTLFLSVLCVALCGQAFGKVTYEQNLSEIVSANSIWVGNTENPYWVSKQDSVYFDLTQTLVDWSIQLTLDFDDKDGNHKTLGNTGGAAFFSSGANGNSNTANNFNLNVKKSAEGAWVGMKAGDGFDSDNNISFNVTDTLTLSYDHATDTMTLTNGENSLTYAHPEATNFKNTLKSGSARIYCQGTTIPVKVLAVEGKYMCSRSVTLENGTQKNYASDIAIYTSGRSDALHSDSGAPAYIVDEAAQLWFAATGSDPANVTIAGDLYLQSTGEDASDNKGALRLDTSANHTLTLSGAVVLGADTTITSHKNDTNNFGKVVFDGAVTGNHTLTLNHRATHTDGSPVEFKKTVDVKGLDISTTATFAELHTESINATGGTITVQKLVVDEEKTTTLAVSGADTSVIINALTMCAESKLTFGTEESHNNSLTTTTLEVNGNSTLNANLVMTAGTMSFASGAQLTLGCSVEIGEGVKIVLTDADIAMIQSGQTVDLILSAEEITLGTGVTELANVYRQNSVGELIKLSSDFKIVADYDNHKVYAMPEPATATLSLLALAGLASRRKRH